MTKTKTLSKILGYYLALPYGYIFFSQKYRLSFSGRLLILEIGRVMPHLPALLGQLGAARECL